MKTVSVFVLLLVSLGLYASERVLPPPTISGQAVVLAGTSYTYSFTQSPVMAPLWDITAGTATITSTWTSGNTFYASVTWTTSGTIRFFDEVAGGAYSTKDITVLATPTTWNETRCGSGTVTLYAALGAGATKVRWYSAASGGTLLTELTSYTTPSISPGTTNSYYVESYNATYSIASSRVLITASAGNTVSAPLSTDPDSRCGTGEVTLSATPDSGSNTIAWYSSPVGGDRVYTGTTFVTPELTESVAYYAASYNITTGCASSRVEVEATVNSIPPAAVGWGTPIRYGSGQTTLQAESFTTDRDGEPISMELDIAVYDVLWYGSRSNATTNVSVLANAKTYATPVLTATTTYYLVTRDKVSGCRSEIVDVKAEVVPFITKASIRTDVLRVTGQKTAGSLATLTTAEKTTTFAYLDGLGRVQQTTVLKGSPSGKDIVMPYEYDAVGRASRQYLPYSDTTTTGVFHSGYKAEQKKFFLATGDKIADDSTAYAVAVYEESPVGRLKEQGNIGKGFQPGQGHSSQAEYSFNTATDYVRKFDGKGISTTWYAAKALTKTKGIDAEGNHTISFTDGNGRTVLVRQWIDASVEGTYTDYLETYYLYNNLGQSTYIISPKGVAELKAGSWNFTSTIKDSYCNQFRYDSRGRVIEKKVPGQAWQYIIYDPLGRVVLTQDGLLKPDNKWMFIKYDDKGNAVMTGIHTNTTYTTRATLQAVVDTLYSKTASANLWYEKRSTALEGYTNRSFPTANLDVLSVNYFDNYDFDNTSGADVSYTSAGLAGEHAPAAYTLGRATGSKRKILGTSTWLKTYVFYDERGRTVQVQSTNPINTGSLDRVTNAYADDGRVLYTRKFHNGPDTLTVRNKYEYTSRGDLWKVSQAHRGTTYQLVVQYEYNEAGQLVDKKLHNTGGSNFMQSVDYRYTIRGQLKSINNSELSSNGLNDETNDYFGMELLYNESESGLNTARYNGSISAMKWKAFGDSVGVAKQQRSYAYTYDKTGRLETAAFKRKGNSIWNKEVGAENEAITYDHNGNIKTLERKQRKHQLTGITASYTNETIDNLTYAYTSGNKNSLEKVTDAASTNAASGFDNGSSSTSNDYTYDANGNLLSDANKGITSIVYNFLGKPTQVNFTDGKKIEYVYDAAGVKLTQKLYNGATLVTTTEYVNGFVYEKAGSGSNVLSFFGSPEGRVVNNSGTLTYEYSIADHQGNTRVVFTSATPAPVIPETDFESSSSTEFIGYNNRSSLSEMNHSASGTYSQLLHGGYNSQVGAATSLHVYPGDTLKAEVYAKYRLATSTSSNLTGFAAALTNAFGVNSGSTGEASNLYTGLNGYGALLAAAGRANDDDAAPKGFITIMLFDKHYNLLDASWDQMGDVAQTSMPPAKDPFDRLFKKMVVTEEGYAYIFVSNENPTKVDIHFDDLKVTHVKSNVIQYNEYYPFGLQTSTSWTRESTKDNNYLYNAANELNKTSGWYEMFYRGYDPATGRMLQIDPYATMYASTTTYNYALNNPVMINDPSGGYVYANAAEDRINKINSRNSSSFFSDWAESFRTDGMQMRHDADQVNMGNMSREDFLSNYGVSLVRSSFGTIVDAIKSGYLSIGNGFITVGSENRIVTGELSEADRLKFNIPSWVNGSGIASSPVRISIESIMVANRDRIDGSTGSSNSGRDWLGSIGNVLNIFGVATTIGIEGSKPVGLNRVDWASRVKAGTKFGRALGGAGLFLTVVDMATNGVNTSNGLDFAFGIVSFIGVPGAIIGGVYFAANIITQGITGKTIGQHVDDNFFIMPVSVGGVPSIMLIPKN